MGNATLGFRNNLTIDYSSAFDPFQSETASLTYTWQCDPLFIGCSNFQNSMISIDAVTLFGYNKIVFNRDYYINVTITNTNTKNFKQVTDPYLFRFQSPQLSTEAPISCLNFTFTFRAPVPFSKATSNLREVTFSNNNFTDILLGIPVVDSSTCASYFGSPVTTLSFMAFDNPALFDDIHSY